MMHRLASMEWTMARSGLTTCGCRGMPCWTATPAWQRTAPTAAPSPLSLSDLAPWSAASPQVCHIPPHLFRAKMHALVGKARSCMTCLSAEMQDACAHRAGRIMYNLSLKQERYPGCMCSWAEETSGKCWVVTCNGSHACRAHADCPGGDRRL